MLFRCAFVVLVGATLILSGCGKHPGESPHDPGSRQPVTGPLVPIVSKLADAKPTNDCDRKFLPLMQEIAGALDANSELVDAYLKSVPPDPNYTRSKFGPIIVRDAISPRAPKSGWLSDSYGWPEITRLYARMKDSSNPADWYALNKEVRGILSDDQYRILGGYVPYLRPEDGERLFRIESALGSDPKQSPAVLARISEADQAWLRSTPYFRDRFASFVAGVPGSGAALLEDVNEEANEFRVTPQPGVSRRGTELSLKLAPGPFGSVAKEFSDFVESVWKGDTVHLKIVWIAPTDGYYDLLVGPDGARARTSWSKKFIEYPSDIRRTTLAHEIGHALGFGDHYYTRWDDANCGYVEEYREDDVMSDELFGHVLPEEFDLLTETYRDGF